jgi:hypothetical protein
LNSVLDCGSNKTIAKTISSKGPKLCSAKGMDSLRALWKPGMPEYHVRNMAEYHGICRNITEYHDIFPEYTGTSQYFPMVAMRLFINMDVWQHIDYKSDGSFPFWRLVTNNNSLLEVLYVVYIIITSVHQKFWIND